MAKEKKPAKDTKKDANRYSRILERIFTLRRKGTASLVPFAREDLAKAARHLGIAFPKNPGDIIYSYRYRSSPPRVIALTQPAGMEWIIEGTGRAQYAFKLVKINRIVPDPAYLPIKVPEATPEIIGAYALSDEQALLAKVRYNRLIDLFLGLTAYSLQNHLRTTVKGIGQIEIDEIYVGVDKTGSQFVVPVQAKGGNDQLSVVQARQDIMCCQEKFIPLVCRAVSAQFMAADVIALFELTLSAGVVKVVDQRHYKLVPADSITSEDLAAYRRKL